MTHELMHEDVIPKKKMACEDVIFKKKKDNLNSVLDFLTKRKIIEKTYFSKLMQSILVSAKNS